MNLNEGQDPEEGNKNKPGKKQNHYKNESEKRLYDILRNVNSFAKKYEYKEKKLQDMLYELNNDVIAFDDLLLRQEVAVEEFQTALYCGSQEKYIAMVNGYITLFSPVILEYEKKFEQKISDISLFTHTMVDGIPLEDPFAGQNGVNQQAQDLLHDARKLLGTCIVLKQQAETLRETNALVNAPDHQGSTDTAEHNQQKITTIFADIGDILGRLESFLFQKRKDLDTFKDNIIKHGKDKDEMCRARYSDKINRELNHLQKDIDEFEDIPSECAKEFEQKILMLWGCAEDTENGIKNYPFEKIEAADGYFTKLHEDAYELLYMYKIFYKRVKEALEQSTG